MKTKPFNQTLHDQCDPHTRNAVIKYLKNVWCVDAIQNPDQYAVDLIGFKDWLPYCYVEVENRYWGRQLHYCPYSTIHVPYRKAKLFNNNLPTFMFVVNHYMENAYWINAEKIKAAPVIEVKNTAVANDEFFYDVPKDEWRLINLEDRF